VFVNVLRCEVEGWLCPRTPLRWIGVALRYFASLCDRGALASVACTI